MHIATRSSPYARWRSLPLGTAAITDGFWRRRQAINRGVSIRHGWRMLEQSGNINNLRLAVGNGEGCYRGPVFMDSDVYKWLEAAASDLAIRPDAELEQQVDELIDLLTAVQMPDGYVNSYYQVNKPTQRWTNLDHDHELYCAGHLFEAAVAHRRATGKDTLFEVATRFADHIDSVFGPGRRDGAPGHPEIELALVELYRECGETRYLDLASFFVDQRGKGRMRGHGLWGPQYHQDRVPVREAMVVEGHAVRQLYLTAGATDVYLETGDRTLLAAMERLWEDMAFRKAHVIGGFGAQPDGEAFGPAYDLTSDHCYCETCAAIAAMMWNWRMLLATGHARYADLLERSLYNGFLSGVSLDGARYFYVNVLQSRGGIERPEWYGCACCPPNVMRQMALVGHYALSSDDAGVQVHQFMPLEANVEMSAVGTVKLRIATDYPWDGHVRIVIEQTPATAWTLAVRIPGWCNQATLCVNGEPVDGAGARGRYGRIERSWCTGDVAELSIPLPVRLIEPHPRIDAIRGCVAIERGPLVYCLEAVDQQTGAELLDLRIDAEAPTEAVWRGDVLDGVMAVLAPGAVVDPIDWDDVLYRMVGAQTASLRNRAMLMAVPYYAWANRGAHPMRVWIPSL